MVANLLGWKQVSGSGSRPFHVGDVVSEEWLGECKTHTTITDKITFKSSVWNKIRIESKSCNRFAVYITIKIIIYVINSIVKVSSKLI